jgi:hypothetical protein
MAQVKTLSNSITDKLDKIEGNANNLKTQCVNYVNIVNGGGNIDAGRILGFGNLLSSLIVRIDSLLSDGDLSALELEAQSRHNDINYSMTAGLNDLRAAVVSCAAYLDATLPKSGNYYLVVETGTNGASNFREFTAAQLSGFITELNAILAAID